MNCNQAGLPVANGLWRIPRLVQMLDPRPGDPRKQESQTDPVKGPPMSFAQLESTPFHALRTKASAAYFDSSAFARSGALRTTFVSASASQHSRALTETLVPSIMASRVVVSTRWLTSFPRHRLFVKHGDEVASAA